MKKYIVLIAIVLSPVNAGVYKWTDKEGNIHFGDRPVNVESATELNIQVNNKTGVTNSSGNKKEREYLLEQIEENKQADAEKKSEMAAKNKKRLKLCDQYKSRLQINLQSRRPYIMSPDGERTYLSDKQRVSRNKELSKAVAKHCR